MSLYELMEEQEIIEKQNRLLSEPDNDDKFSYSQVRARAAKRDAEIDNLLKRYSPSDVEYILEPLGVRPCHVQARVAKLERERGTDSDIDIITGEAFATGGYVGIIQP
jgi:hypothetical protein